MVNVHLAHTKKRSAFRVNCGFFVAVPAIRHATAQCGVVIRQPVTPATPHRACDRLVAERCRSVESGCWWVHALAAMSDRPSEHDDLDRALWGGFVDSSGVDFI